MTRSTRRAKNVASEQNKASRTIAEIPDDFLDCRDLGHSWSYARASEDKRFRNFIRAVVCSRCGSERLQVISQSGFLVGTSYHYATGYLLKGHGNWSTDDRARIRLRNLRRML